MPCLRGASNGATGTGQAQRDVTALVLNFVSTIWKAILSGSFRAASAAAEGEVQPQVTANRVGARFQRIDPVEVKSRGATPDHDIAM